MSDTFESWWETQTKQGLKDFKLVLGGDTSEASVRAIKSEVVRLHKIAEAKVTTELPMAKDYSIELAELNQALNN